jgi:acetyltransferase-like isoleucine patch superfamily enzyme
MFVRPLKAFVRWLAMRHGRAQSLWLLICKPRNDEYAEFLRRHGGLHSIGKDCRINTKVEITDPAYVSIGNNVTLSSCALIGHDASIAVIGRATGKKLDSVGKIDIRDNVFIGYGAILLPGITVGPNAIVAAGSVVNRDVSPGTVVAGVPAHAVGSFDDLAARLESKTQQLPWADLIARRNGDFDPNLEPALVQMRVNHFYGSDSVPAPSH